MNAITLGLKTLRKNSVLALGVLLLLLSAREDIYLIDGFSRYQTTAYGWRSPSDPPLHFKIKCTGNKTFIDFHGQKAMLSDAFKVPPPNPDGSFADIRKMGKVNIHINGRDYTDHTPTSEVEIRIQEEDANRYWSEVMVAELTDSREGKTRLAILQSSPHVDLFSNYSQYNLDSMKCRILFLDENGKVEEESFYFADRNHPFYRFLLAGYVSPQELGTVPLKPLLYAFFGGILGLILTAKGRSHLKKNTNAPSQ